MTIIVRGRRGGKTHDLLEMVRTQGATLLVANAAEKYRIERTMMEGWTVGEREAATSRIMVASRERVRGMVNRQLVLVDNLDLLLLDWLGTVPAFVTMTEPVDVDRK